tara:strand:+ start:817 stop:954 length:138 start_codon:yes stop_codon:yes gene_type:complete
MSSFDKLLKQMGAKRVNWKSRVKPKPFKPVPYFEEAYKRVLSRKK